MTLQRQLARAAPMKPCSADGAAREAAPLKPCSPAENAARKVLAWRSEAMGASVAPRVVQEVVDPAVDVLGDDVALQAGHAPLALFGRHLAGPADRGREAEDVVGIDQQRAIGELDRAPANSESTSTPPRSTWQAQYSLATRFIPSLSGVARQTLAAR